MATSNVSGGTQQNPGLNSSQLAHPQQKKENKSNGNDRIAKAELRLEENEFDLEAWNILIKDCEV